MVRGNTTEKETLEQRVTGGEKVWHAEVCEGTADV